MTNLDNLIFDNILSELTFFSGPWFVLEKFHKNQFLPLTVGFSGHPIIQ